MGYPELPPEGGDKLDLDHPNAIAVNFHPPTSEDSDNNDPNATDSPYTGYEQLSNVSADGETYTGNPINGQEDDDDEDDSPTIEIPTNYPSDFAEIECSGAGNSFPDVVPVDIEVAQEIWNAPPAPDRSNAIQLDDSRTNQIINLMSGISLPENCIPEWAHNLSEDKWKQDLLEKIRRGDRDN